MPEYDYECPECGDIKPVVHSMKESPEVLCDCGSAMQKTISGNFAGWVRGDGIVKDKPGARRDMDLYKLQNEDPYSRHRVSGEKSYLEDRFRRAGKTKESLRRASAQWGKKNGKWCPLNKRAEELDAENGHLER